MMSCMKEKVVEQAWPKMAIDVADYMLLSFLPLLIKAIDLRIDGMCLIHDGI